MQILEPRDIYGLPEGSVSMKRRDLLYHLILSHEFVLSAAKELLEDHLSIDCNSMGELVAMAINEGKTVAGRKGYSAISP